MKPGLNEIKSGPKLLEEYGSMFLQKQQFMVIAMHMWFLMENSIQCDIINVLGYELDGEIKRKGIKKFIRKLLVLLENHQQAFTKNSLETTTM